MLSCVEVNIIWAFIHGSQKVLRFFFQIIPSGDILPAKKPRRDGRSDGVRNRQYLPMNRKVDTGPCKFNLDADSEMEASPLQILEALFANEGTLVTHTGSFHLL